MKGKISIGLYLTAVSAVLALVGFIAYMVNTGTNYYAKMGVNSAVVGFLIAAVLVTALRIFIGLKDTPLWADLLPVCACVLLTCGLMFLVSARANNLAAVFTFENSAANMADTTSCIAAIVCCLLAQVIGIVSAFFDMRRE